MDEGKIEVDLTELCGQLDDMVADMGHFVLIMQICEARISAMEAALKKAGIEVARGKAPTIQ